MKSLCTLFFSHTRDLNVKLCSLYDSILFLKSVNANQINVIINIVFKPIQCLNQCNLTRDGRSLSSILQYPWTIEELKGKFCTNFCGGNGAPASLDSSCSILRRRLYDILFQCVPLKMTVDNWCYQQGTWNLPWALVLTSLLVIYMIYISFSCHM